MNNSFIISKNVICRCSSTQKSNISPLYLLDISLVLRGLLSSLVRKLLFLFQLTQLRLIVNDQVSGLFLLLQLLLQLDSKVFDIVSHLLPFSPLFCANIDWTKTSQLIVLLPIQLLMPLRHDLWPLPVLIYQFHLIICNQVVFLFEHALRMQLSVCQRLYAFIWRDLPIALVPLNSFNFSVLLSPAHSHVIKYP